MACHENFNPMRANVVAVLQAVHQVALSLWLGGGIAIGAIAAPAVFGAARRAGDTEWGQPLYTFAGTALGDAFQRLNVLCLIACAIALVTGVAYGCLAGLSPHRLGWRTALVLAAGIVAAWLTVGLYPAMLSARESGDMVRFDAMHRQYSTAFQLQALLLFASMVVTGRMHLDHLRPEASALPRRAGVGDLDPIGNRG